MDRSASVRFAGKTQRGFAVCLMWGIVSWVLFALAFLLILTLIAYRNADPTRLITPFSYTALCMSAFVSGFSAGKTRQKQGAFIGATAGALVTLLMMCVALFTGSGVLAEHPGLTLGFYAAVIGLASLGGALGGRRPARRNRRRKH